MSIVLFGMLILLIAVGMPIALSLTGATLVTLLTTTDVIPIVVTQRFFTAVDSFSLMAIPFFMMAGSTPSFLQRLKKMQNICHALALSTF